MEEGGIDEARSAYLSAALSSLLLSLLIELLVVLTSDLSLLRLILLTEEVVAGIEVLESGGGGGEGGGEVVGVFASRAKGGKVRQGEER